MSRRRVAILGLAVVVVGAAVPAGASAHTKTVTLVADQPFRGYEVRITATKQDPDPPNPSPVGITIELRNDVQVHRYSFEGSRRALVFSGRNLRSGRLRLWALGGPPPARLQGLTGYGRGVIHFAATGPRRSTKCGEGDRRTESRSVRSTSGQLQFSPTQKAEDEFTRGRWRGRTQRFVFGGCEELPPCRSYTRLLANGPGSDNWTFALLAWRYDAVQQVKVQAGIQEVDPAGPATFITHDRVAHIARSRFEATGLDSGSLDLDGIPGLGGSIEITTAGDPQQLYPPCPATWKGGTATGSVQAAFAFAPDQDDSAWDEGTVYRTDP